VKRWRWRRGGEAITEVRRGAGRGGQGVEVEREERGRECGVRKVSGSVEQVEERENLVRAPGCTSLSMAIS